MGAQGDFTLVGYSSHSAMTAFVAGTCQVTDGEVFDEAAAELSFPLPAGEAGTLFVRLHLLPGGQFEITQWRLVPHEQNES